MLATSGGVGKGAKKNGTTSVQVSWTAASDNVGVKSYLVYRSLAGGSAALVSTTSSLSFQDTGTVAGAGTYTYWVKAQDAAGNLSPASASASVSR